jgi:hypothetical protein
MSASIESLFGPKKEQPKQVTEVAKTPLPEEKTPIIPTPPAPEMEKIVETPQAPSTTSQPQTESTQIAPPKQPVEQPKVVQQFSLPEAPKAASPIVNPLLSQATNLFGSKSNTPEMPIQPLPKMPEKFDMTPEKPSVLKYITIFGGKNSGKTVVALSFPGKIVALSFDHKTVPTWITMFNADERITVYDAIRYLDYSSPDASLISAEYTFRYIYAILDEIKAKDVSEHPDWVLIDGLDEYLKIAENVMRWRNGLKMTQGVEWTLWKDRSLYIKQLFLKLASVVKKGVIFCTKYDFEEVIISSVTKERIKKPVWVDIIERQSDIEIEAYSEEDRQSGVVTFTAHVKASKYIQFPTGRKANVTAEPGKIMAYYQLTKDTKPEAN